MVRSEILQVRYGAALRVVTVAVQFLSWPRITASLNAANFGKVSVLHST